MAVSTKSPKSSKKAPARRVAKKVAAKVLPEARIKAKSRNVESRSRAVAESGVKATAPRVEIYRLKNRATGETRVLIDARGDGSVAELPWLVTNGTQTVGFATRKELGANYSRADLFSGKAPKATKAKARRVAAKK